MQNYVSIILKVVVCILFMPIVIIYGLIDPEGRFEDGDPTEAYR